MSTIYRILIAITLPLALCVPVLALSVPTSNLALLSNGTVEVGEGSYVLGDIAGTTQATIHKNVLITGSAYTGGAAWVNQNTEITGSLHANGSTSFDSGVTVGGDVTSGGTSWLAQNSNVGGNVESTGSITTGKGVDVAGDVNSGANIHLGQNTTVGGNASPGIGGTLTTSGGVTIGGNTTPSNPTVPTVSVPTVTPGSTPSYTGSGNTWLPNNTNLALAPGTYGNFSTGAGVDLFFTAGAYELGQIWLGNSSTLNFDTTGGDIILNLFGDFGTGDNLLFDITGSGLVYVNLYDGNFWTGNSSTMNAIINVYDGTFGTGERADITGSVWSSGDILIGKNSTVTYQGANPNPPVPGVPEPLTALSIFCATGALGGYLCRRVKNKGPKSALCLA